MKKQTHEVVSYTLDGLLEDFFVLVFRGEKIMSFYLGHQDFEDIMFMASCDATVNEQAIVHYIESEAEDYVDEYVGAYVTWNEV